MTIKYQSAFVLTIDTSRHDMMHKPSRAALHALRTTLEKSDMNQRHLFAHWPGTAEDYNESQLHFLEELYEFDHSYRGGVTEYIRTARRLLGGDDDKSADCMLQLRMPQHLMQISSLFDPSAELQALELRGVNLLRKSVFVLVAGGLGERLGYSDIKVSLPLETATRVTYLEHYLQWAQQAGGLEVPFVIMTSDDTHARTVELLRHIPCAQAMTHVRLLKQETVPCLSDSEAHLTIDATGQLVRKPHGHGDIHSLIYSAKGMPDDAAHSNHDGSANTDEGKSLIQCWLDAGYEYVCFFQDTNAIATTTIPLTLAVSARENWAMNFTCVPRQPREAVGLLCDVRMRLDDGEDSNSNDNKSNIKHDSNSSANATSKSASDSRNAASANSMTSEGVWVTRNIEYNVFESVARKLTKEGGDVAAEGSAYSPYPGSINTLICQLGPYAERVQATCGSVPEFINPKYADNSRRAFKKPARVESLMQDFALLFADTHYKVGGTVLDRFTYQPVKNHIDEAVVKARANERPYCPTTGETDYYEFMRRRVRAVGVNIHTHRSNSDHKDNHGDMNNHSNHEDEVYIDLMVEQAIPVTIFPIVTLDHLAAGCDTLEDLQRVFPTPAEVHISAKSTLVVDGHVIIESLKLDGALHLCGPRSSSEKPLVVRNLVVNNAHWGVRGITPEDTDEADRVRGFVLVKTPMTVVAADGSVTDEASKL